MCFHDPHRACCFQSQRVLQAASYSKGTAAYPETLQEHAMESFQSTKKQPLRIDLLFLLLFPSLAGKLGEGPGLSRRVIEKGIRCLDGQIRSIIPWAATSDLIVDVRQEFLTVVIEDELLDKYEPTRGRPWDYFGGILRRLALRYVKRHHRRSPQIADDDQVLLSREPDPREVLAYREQLEAARDAYLLLGRKQRGAVRIVYPFLAVSRGDELVDSKTERVDRHRGLKKIRSAVEKHRNS
jgi:hypothetical protein